MVLRKYYSVSSVALNQFKHPSGRHCGVTQIIEEQGPQLLRILKYWDTHSRWEASDGNLYNSKEAR
jgi:hypothetical protein